MFSDKNYSFLSVYINYSQKKKKSTQRKRGEITTGEARFAVELDNDNFVV